MTPPDSVEKLGREAFFQDGIKITLLDHLKYMPPTFSINDLTDYMVALANEPFKDFEIKPLRGRIRTGMKSLRKSKKVMIHFEPTESNQLLTYYTKI